MSQTAYSVNMAVGMAGDKYDSAPNQDVLSKNNPADLPIGLLVVKDSGGDDAVKLPAAGSDITTSGKPIGVAIRKMDMAANLPAGSATIYPAKSSVPVLKKGRVWVTVEEAVAPNDPVYVRFADGNGGFTQKGSFRKSVDQVSSADTAALLAGAKYITTASAGGLAALDLDLP